MRTLWVTNDLPPRAGGIEQFLGNLLDRTWPEAALVVGPEREDAADHDADVAWTVQRQRGVSGRRPRRWWRCVPRPPPIGPTSWCSGRPGRSGS